MQYAWIHYAIERITPHTKGIHKDEFTMFNLLTGRQLSGAQADAHWENDCISKE